MDGNFESEHDRLSLCILIRCTVMVVSGVYDDIAAALNNNIYWTTSAAKISRRVG